MAALPRPNPAGGDPGGGEEPVSLEDLYHINVVPSELFLKFRKEAQGFRLGLNLEFYNFQGNEYEAKLVLKPMAPERRWKFVYEPIHGDIRVLSKKIPLTKYLNLQDLICGLVGGQSTSFLRFMDPLALENLFSI